MALQKVMIEAQEAGAIVSGYPNRDVEKSVFASSQVIATRPDCETRATNGPGTELRILSIRGRAAEYTAAISLPRRLPAFTSSVRIGSTPSDRSMKNIVPSGGFAVDCFFDVTGLQAEVVRKISDGIAGSISLVDG